MIRFYLSENLGRILTEAEYKSMLQREVKEYNFGSIEEAEEKDTDYTKVIEIEENLQGELWDIDNILQTQIYATSHLTYEDSMCENVYDVLENKSFSYYIINGNYINVEFDIISEIDGDETEIKIKNIELI